MTPQEVHDIGLREVERIRGRWKTSFEAVEFEGEFSDFLEFLRTDERFYAKSGEELLEKVSWILKRMDGALPKLFRTLPRTPYGLEPVPDYIAAQDDDGLLQPAVGRRDASRGSTRSTCTI